MSAREVTVEWIIPGVVGVIAGSLIGQLGIALIELIGGTN